MKNYVALYLLLSTGYSACNDQTTCDSILGSVGLIDEKTEPPETADLLCDWSDGSTCDEKNFKETVEVVLQQIEQRPGSSMRLWIIPKKGDQPEMIAEAINKPPKPSESEKIKGSSSWTIESKKEMIDSIARVIKNPRPRRSPLATAITVIAQRETVTAKRRIIVISDLREVGVVNMERKSVSEKAWLAALHDAGALGPKSLNGIDVRFIYVDAQPLSRKWSLRRDQEIRERWSSAIGRAGAESVHVLHGGLRLDDMTPAEKGNGDGVSR